MPNSLRGARATTMNTIDMSPLLMEFVIHWKEILLKGSMKNLLIIIREVGFGHRTLEESSLKEMDSLEEVSMLKQKNEG